ncbi:hypothetical protein [Streptomyces fractus]|uniref:hypothetical protein n=1 Tax=Streptomyces fractus TaxID=641806 RepID=UPI003CF84D45
MRGQLSALDVTAKVVSRCTDPEAARAVVREYEKTGGYTAIRNGLNKNSLRSRDGIAVRLAVIAAGCGWEPGDPWPGPGEAPEGFRELWEVIRQLSGVQRLVSLPVIAFGNWAPTHKRRSPPPPGRLVRSQNIQPLFSFAAPGAQPSRLDALMLSALRIEAHGAWVHELAPAVRRVEMRSANVAEILHRLIRILDYLDAVVRSEWHDVLAAAPTAQQRAAAALLSSGPHTGIPDRLMLPVLQLVDSMTGIGPARRRAHGTRDGARRCLGPEQQTLVLGLERYGTRLRAVAQADDRTGDLYYRMLCSLERLKHHYLLLVEAAVGEEQQLATEQRQDVTDGSVVLAAAA